MNRDNPTSPFFSILIMCIFWILAFGFFSQWVKAKNMVAYTSPALGDLIMSKGFLTYTIVHKGSGGNAVIRQQNGDRIELVCRGFVGNIGNCYSIKKGNVVINFKNETNFKQAEVWWYPERNEKFGRLYQLKVGDKVFLDYADQVARYSHVAQVEHENNGDLFMSLLFLGFAVYSTNKFNKYSSKLRRQ